MFVIFHDWLLNHYQPLIKAPGYVFIIAFGGELCLGVGLFRGRDKRGGTPIYHWLVPGLDFPLTMTTTDCIMVVGVAGLGFMCYTCHSIESRNDNNNYSNVNEREYIIVVALGIWRVFYETNNP